MSKIVHTNTVKFLDVISSGRFVHGRKQSSLYDDKPIAVGYESPWPHDDSTDETRSSARYIVLSICTAGNTEGLGGPRSTWTVVTAQRLNVDDTFNPKGEIICFPIDNGYEDEIREVALVGRMQMKFIRE